MATARVHRGPALQRRTALLQAAIRIIGDEGVAAITHRAVAARAEIPLANTTYFFTSIDEVIIEALRMWSSQRSTELNQLADTLAAQRANPEEVLEAFVANLLQAERSTELAQYEAYLHAARYPELREAVAETQEAFVRVAAAALKAAGATPQEADCQAFAALVDGFMIGHLANPAPDATERLTTALRALFSPRT